MRKSRLPASGGNVFMRVRQKRTEALERGAKLFDLSIGEPRGAALLSARQAASAAILSEDEAMHAYQYNASPAVPDFSRRFVRAHVDPLPNDVEFLPIPGIKPILGLLPLACGSAEGPVTVATMTRPGYPTPADWCALQPNVTHLQLPLNVDNEFRFAPEDVPETCDLAMLNYPHNPSGQVASREWLRAICRHCAAHDIRLFNDAAYIALGHDGESATLSEAVGEFPELSWAEAFTAAKLIGNGTGWHVGAMVGSPDFIADTALIKGKTDTGFVAPMAAGAIAALEDDQAGIAEYRVLYRRRLDCLIELMEGAGMRLALAPKAGFYTLWQTPSHAFGAPVDGAEAFNFRMIDETGVVGVPFTDYLRYAVCADVVGMADDLKAAFEKAEVGYD